MARLSLAGWVRARLPALAAVQALRTVRLAARLLWAASVPLLVWVFGVFFLLVPVQTQDLLTEARAWQLGLFCLAVTVWAVTCWFWTRWTLNLEPVRWPERHALLGPGAQHILALDADVVQPGRFLRKLIGRLPLFASVVVGAIPFVRSGTWLEPAGLLCLFLLLAAEGLLIWAAMNRHRVLPRWFNNDGVLPAVTFSRDGVFPWATCRDRLPFGRGSVIVWFALFALLLAVTVAYPVTVPTFMGAPAFAFFALSALGGILTFCSGLIRRRTGLPGLVFMLLIPLLVGQLNPNHAIRLLEAEGPDVDLQPGTTAPVGLHRRPAQRPLIDEALERWTAACHQTEGPLRIVVVATAGGASRAALWTASALHEAERAVGPAAFRRALFALSGVSGGSLGAAAYVAGLPPGGCGEVSGDEVERWKALRTALSRNFLPSPVAAYLTNDIASRFVPIRGIPDRAAALEQAWENEWRAAWKDTLPRTADLRGGFLSVWMAAGGGWREPPPPLLFMNGTHAQTGLPIVTAPVRITRDSFPAAFDLLGLVDRDVRVSTAVTNSARFPLVTPGGTLPDPKGLQPWGEVMDGGYVENFGALLHGYVGNRVKSKGCRKYRFLKLAEISGT
jgi:hypothetical protein